MIRMSLSLVAAALLCLATCPTVAAQTSSSGPAPRSRSTAKAPFTGTLNINTASATDLQALPGIGAKTAARIVDYRQKNGPFKKIEELMNVQGVGEKNFLKLKPQITVAAPKPERAAAQTTDR
jgi:competence protein ComEA